MKTPLRPSLWAGAVLLTAPVLCAAAIEFAVLGTLPSGQFPDSEATAVSADGKVIVGVNRSFTAGGDFRTEAFRWEDNVMVGLGDLPGGSFESFARGVSANGSVVVGFSDTNDGWHAFRWVDNKMTDLGRRVAEGVSADGTVVVGYVPTSPFEDYEAVRWVNGVLEDLGFLDGKNYSQAWAVSADGSVVVGSSASNNGQQAFLWEAGSIVGLGELPGGEVGSRAWAVSTDGSIVVGESDSPRGSEAFKWENGVMTPLGVLPGSCCGSQAHGISADGSTIVGWSFNTDGFDRATLWRREDGFSIRSLNEFLDTNGINRHGWLLETATAISADGSTVVGRAVHPQIGANAFRLKLKDVRIIRPRSTIPIDLSLLPGQLRILFPALEGSTYELLSSPDFQTWQPVEGTRRTALVASEATREVDLQLEILLPASVPGPLLQLVEVYEDTE